MIAHTTTECPTDPGAPVFFAMQDHIPTYSPTAGELNWGDLPEDEGLILAWSPVAYGDWTDAPERATPWPCAATSLVECELTDGSRFVEYAVHVAWALAADEPGRVVRWRTLAPATRSTCPACAACAGGALPALEDRV